MKNGLIRSLMLIANKNPEQFKDGSESLTLNVGGQIIVGRIISRDDFLNQPQNKSLKIIDDAYTSKMTPEQIEIEESEMSLENTNYLYLKNACYFIDGKFIPSNGNNYMSVHIDSIDAFNIGSLARD
ncbi:hypothetical protein [Acinetobacter bereziniae]|uniref:hypothetical protein n=1 Tax=Acinetobacter bereziniae TaxID=106648 RepID=UPI00125F41B6|nr:hypothetical protein [Acinetobacter bereziniae]